MAGEKDDQQQDDDLEMRRERGDFVDEDEKAPSKDDEKVAAKADAEDGEGVEDGDGEGEDRGTKIPYPRFKEVNERALRLEGENAELRRRIEAGGKQPAAPEAPPVDIKTLRKQARDAMLEGDTDKAAELDAQADEALALQAEERAVARVQQANAVTDLNRAAERIAKRYPFLDSTSDDADQEAIELVVAARDALIRKGRSLADALEEAADKVAKMHGGKSKEKDDGDDPAAQRERQAVARGAKAANAQPALPAGGRGERGRIQSGAEIDVSKLSDEEFSKMPEKERAIARGDFV